jgi:hypothetical protein
LRNLSSGNSRDVVIARSSPLADDVAISLSVTPVKTGVHPCEIVMFPPFEAQDLPFEAQDLPVARNDGTVR